MSAEAESLELLVGIEGLALLRGLHRPGESGGAARRLAEVEALLRRRAGAAAPAHAARRVGSGQPIREADARVGSGEPIREAGARVGYAGWSESYDDPGNPIVELEQPIVWSMLAGLAPGRALDAACGTGRHARRLVALGHVVTGVDLTPEMLDLARAAVPAATFAEGDLRHLPAPDASFDVAVCALALAHLPDVAPALAELARVLAPDGHLVVSTLHPLQIQLGWHAMFTHPDGRRAFVREHPHSHADYLRAFREADLELLDCAEPTLRDVDVRAKRRAFAAIPEASLQAYTGLPAVLAWHLRRAGSPGR